MKRLKSEYGKWWRGDMPTNVPGDGVFGIYDNKERVMQELDKYTYLPYLPHLPPPSWSQGDEKMPDLIAMIRSRLRLNPAAKLELDFINAFQVNPDRVVVFICHKENAVILEDDALFPSDNLMTQLRLIMSPK